ncbi:MAG TPA: glycosyltransferase [Nitrococcus sp.]|nr:glycosyltransferase [Nitrococcus sp.]
MLASTYPRWRVDHEPGFVHELCKRLTERFEVLVLTSSAPGAAAYERMDGVEIIRYRYAPRRLETLVYGGGIATHLKRRPWKLIWVPGFILGQYLAARRLLKERRIDLIHAHWLIPQGLIARWLAWRVAVPFVVTSHGGDLFGLRGRLFTAGKRKVAKSCAAMTVVSRAMRDEAVCLGLAPPRLAVLAMGADMRGRFTPGDKTMRSTDELLFVGRLVAKKGLPHLLDAMPEVLRRCPSAHLSIAGFGPEAAALKAQARRLGIEDQVRFLGAVTQENLPALYRRAAVLVAPFIREASGNQEGLPVVLMEAIACGCPVIAGRIAGVDELFGEASADVCVNATDTEALAGAIVATLTDPAAARERARRLRAGVLNRLDWAVIANGYADLLAFCLPGSSVSGRAHRKAETEDRAP